jgi:ketosteroid isomerase-like protein
MNKILLTCLFLLFSSITFCQNKDETAIRHLLAAQAEQWNKGNISGFMKGYWENDSLVFIGKSGPTYGYKATLERYQKGYPDQAHMGKLTSTIISMKKLSADYYFVIGKWALERSAGDVSGSYTLLFHKIKGAWVIVCDHSS